MSNKTEHYSRLQLEKMARRKTVVPQDQTIRKLAREVLELRYGKAIHEDALIEKASREGWYYHQLADALGVSENAARQRALVRGVRLNRLRVRWTTEDDAKIAQMLTLGLTAEEGLKQIPMNRTLHAVKARMKHHRKLSK